ncbi:MAG: hypothetical protein ACUVRF_11435, partial [Desulfotomaculales bacterium]
YKCIPTRKTDQLEIPQNGREAYSDKVLEIAAVAAALVKRPQKAAFLRLPLFTSLQSLDFSGKTNWKLPGPGPRAGALVLFGGLPILFRKDGVLP